MKNIFIFLVLISNALAAQKKCKMVDLDFNSRVSSCAKCKNKITIPKRLKIGDYYQVRIKNINQNLFSISINNIDTILSSKQKTPTFSDINNYLPEGNAEKSQSQSLSPGVIREYCADILNDFENQINNFIGKINAKNTSINSLKSTVNKIRLESQSIYTTSNIFDENKYNVSFDSISKELNTIFLQVIEKNNEYLNASKGYCSTVSDDDSFQKRDENIKSNFLDLQKSIKALQESISSDKIYDLMSELVTTKNNNGDYYSLPLQFSGEQTRLLISITPRESKFKFQSYTTQIIFPIVPYQYNVTGVSYYYSWLNNEGYTVEKPSDTSYQYKLDASGNHEGGLAVFYRKGLKFSESKLNWLGAHISIGAGMSIAKNIRPRVLLGGGFSLGRKHMIAIDAGLILGYVDKLNPSIDLSKVYLEKQRPDPIIVSNFKHSCYLSIGYIFSF